MRATARTLLRIKLIEGDAIATSGIRLPPVSPQPKAKKTERRTFNETARAALNVTQTVEKASEIDQGEIPALFTSSKLPDNLRVEIADKKKTMFWKVAKPERQELRKILREA